MTTIICHFCFETFEIFLDNYNTTNTEIWDCEVCCNPNKIQYQIRNGEIIIFDISDGNE